MKRLFLLLVIFTKVLIFFPKGALAYDPTTLPNNTHGIHIANPVDLKDAANLVNSNGGQWGYVTFVINQNELDRDRWQKIFDEARRLKVIPIVRIASSPDGGVWSKPEIAKIDEWIGFLDSLNWVVKNRYVIVGNEPNHAKEWGGEVSPEEYAIYLKAFSLKLKEKSLDFFVLPAGFDASAPNSSTTLNEAEFISRMLKAEPTLFDQIDGWTSHSYPNPAFSGSEKDSGKGSIKTFDWELAYLKSFGINKDLPIFITETGWIQKTEGYSGGLSDAEIAEKLTYAYQNVWNDKRIAAVTPFILSYPEHPFGNFSWKNRDGSFRTFFESVKALPKTEGKPEQIEKGEILSIFMLPIQFAESEFSGFALVKNEGQSIWESPEIKLVNEEFALNIDKTSFESLEPFHIGAAYFSGKAPGEDGIYTSKTYLARDGVKISEEYTSKVVVDNSTSLKVVGAFDRLIFLFQDLKLRFGIK